MDKQKLNAAIDQLLALEQNDAAWGEAFIKAYGLSPPDLQRMLADGLADMLGIQPLYRDSKGVAHYSAEALARALGITEEAALAFASKVPHALIVLPPGGTSTH
jgi:hypothetical protein